MTGANQVIKFSIFLSDLDLLKIGPIEIVERDKTELRFINSWSYLFNEKIYETTRLPCAFAYEKQKFYKRRDNGNPYFRTWGYCRDKNCNNLNLIGECQDLEENGGMKIEFSCFNTYGMFHTAVINCKGTKRKELGKKMLGEKAAKTRGRKAGIELNESGQHSPLLHSKEAMRVVRQEYKDKSLNLENYSGDPITSIMKIMEDVPVIKELSTVPFYIIYHTDNQLQLWKEAHQLGLWISIDASGGFSKKPKVYKNNVCASVFFYVVVSHINEEICPLTQFLSSAHDTDAIFNWLMHWLASGAQIPRLCVLDCSGALLNAASLAFNEMYYPIYLEKCFDILMGYSKEELPACLIKRDRAHLLKNFAKLKFFQGSNWVKKDFYMHSLGFLLQVENIQEFQYCCESLFIIANSDYCDKGFTCQDRTEWWFKKIASFDHKKYYNYHSTNNVHEESLPETDYLNKATLGSEMPEDQSSRLQNWVYDLYNSAIKMCSLKGTKANNYRMPKGFSDYLITLFLQFPAWTNVMNILFNCDVIVATSSCSECFFKIMKYDREMKITTCNRFILANLEHIIETTKIGRQEIKKIIQSKVENMRNKNDDTSNIDERSSNTVQPMSDKINPNETAAADFFKKIINGNLQNFPVAVYESQRISDQVFSCKNLGQVNFTVYSDAFLSLAGQNLIEGHIIDAFMIVNSLTSWNNCTDKIHFISTDYTNDILGWSADSTKHEEWKMYHINFEFDGIIFLPYCYEMHWCMLVVNTKERTIMHLDPYCSNKYDDRAFKLFTNYINICKKNTGNSLCNIVFTRKKAPNSFPVQQLQDRKNCGVFLMAYMKYLTQTDYKKSKIVFNITQMRLEIANLLINNAHTMLMN